MLARKGPSLTALVASLLLSATAAANGRFPAANQIVVDPSNPDHVVGRTTYGLITTQDGGQAWDWVCEQAVGWTGQYDPPMAVTKDGTLIAGVYDHLSVGTQGGCVWDRPGPLDQKNVVDVSAQKDDPSVAVALTSNPANGMFTTQVWRSSNNGKDWAQLGVDLPVDVVGLTIDVAPSNPSFLAVTGQVGVGGTGVLVRSSDGGATWQKLPVPGTDSDHAPFLAAIDPNDELRLYVRLSGPQGPLLTSDDGGDTWSTVFTGQGILKGFALSPDGKELLVGGETDGIHRLSTTDFVETKVSDLHAQCLAWVGQDVFVCASESKDGFTIGRSKDGGATFTAVNQLACVRGPLECAAATETGKSCPTAWAATADLIDQPSCKQGSGGGGAGGSSGGGGAGGGATSGGTGGVSTTTSGGAGGGGGEGQSEGGCGCRTAGGAADSLAGAVCALAVAGAFARRRRSRGRTSAPASPHAR